MVTALSVGKALGLIGAALSLLNFKCQDGQCSITIQGILVLFNFTCLLLK